ncbi:hypothetical protein [Desulfoluna spongiiphila]|uniref:hypothetical protein n=1 Tax=Desulfoluna spongiiphila TaxID=419481 RepID=UPI001253C4AD|nr:hypothetical protein [Desulfoluna spongiiphila]VVS95099.1 consensus disorder prediction [Desulfoluna spongiiphila]
MSNFYIGSNTSQHQNGADDTLRSGYNKKIKENGLDLNSIMGTDDVKSTTAGATGTEWGAFTSCGGLIVKTENDVYMGHCKPSGALFKTTGGGDWKEGAWLYDNRANITQAVVIEFGFNEQVANLNRIVTYFDENETPYIRIKRNSTLALRASADLTGILIMSKLKYDTGITRNWVDITEVNEGVDQPAG